MSLYGMMRTGVSGMAAQSSRLATTADNIANSDTTGYKRSSTEFSSMVMPNTGRNYTSGGVTTTVFNSISQQGIHKYTTSALDLAVDGNGFFVVQGGDGKNYLTRAGAFVPDGQGRLVNAAGFQLMAYPYGFTPAAGSADFSSLVPVAVPQGEIPAQASTQGAFQGSLPTGSTPVAPANLPSANGATAQSTVSSSLVIYDGQGIQRILDVHFTNTGAGTWEVAVFDRADAAPGGGFPYSSPALGSGNLTFDPVTGALDPAVTSLSLSLPSGQAIDLDFSQLTETGTQPAVVQNADGYAGSAIEKVEISRDGVVSAIYGNGTIEKLFSIPLAEVPSPDRLTVLPGNVFSASSDSGDVTIGLANQKTRGAIVSGALENSNVDIAEELTEMIAAQRSYTANSKVFQTGSELMDVLVNLKR
ncbi:flagellar hook protein FlgE [Aquamicrobium ahrensii]|uniref:Flagellar hook protein FlgE n=1 Tax=Aquamicrobium ahrensii TaxID=469551 RepID=A0ABV2KLJ9_9HYPH